MWSGQPQAMTQSHRHHDLELNFIVRGTGRYVCQGQHIQVQEGDLVLLWGAIPHRLLECHPDSSWIWLTLPLAEVLPWNLPVEFVQRLLGEMMVFSAGAGLGIGTPHLDLPGLFARWLQDQHHHSSLNRAALHLELQAFFLRLAHHISNSNLSNSNLSDVQPFEPQIISNSKTLKMSQFIVNHYLEAITPRIIAHQVNLSLSYAATLFKANLGLTLGEYLCTQRIAHAQRLLLTSELSILDVALESGFGSISQFYHSFQSICKQSPLQYRKRFRNIE